MRRSEFLYKRIFVKQIHIGILRDEIKEMKAKLKAKGFDVSKETITDVYHEIMKKQCQKDAE